MKLFQLIKAKPVLDILVSSKLPAKVSYRIARSLDKINSELKTFEDTRVNMLNQMGTLNADKNIYEFEDGKAAEFQAAIAQVQTEELTFELPKFTAAEMGDCTIEPIHLVTLIDIGMLVD